MSFHTPQAIIALLICISVLVVAHEWGHFIVARIFGIRVDDFSVGFGPRLFRVGKLGSTEYNFRMLPLGGFVKIHGMDADEEPLRRAQEDIKRKKTDDDPDSHELPLIAENTPENFDDQGPDSFATKPLWQRSLVILAGPVMSFLLGYAVLCLMGWALGTPSGDPTNKILQVQPGGEGQKIGLRTNDVIVAINGKPVVSGTRMIETIYNSVGQMMHLTVRRGSQTIELNGRPRPYKDDDGKVLTFVRVAAGSPVMPGIDLRPGDFLDGLNNTPIENSQQAIALLRKNAGKPVTLEISRDLQPVTLHATLPAAASQPMPEFADTVRGVFNFVPAHSSQRVSLKESISDGNAITREFFMNFANLFHHRQQLKKSAGGIIAIYQATDLAAQVGVSNVIFLFAQVSLSLAVFNLLPIPVLDGGHLLAFFIEWVRRGRKFTPQQQQAFLLTGFAIIGVLVCLVVYNDIARTIRGQIPQ